jgi:hypothetical protein
MKTGQALRAVLTLSAALWYSAGCTDIQLRRSTVRQASTLTELQYQVVLDNLAMFAADPNALPWHVALKTGAAQVTDTGTAGFLLDIDGGVATHPNIFGSRSVVEQWGTIPATDGTTLRLLRMAYQSAFGELRILNVDQANDLAHELSRQIGTTADISIDSDTLRQLTNLYSPPRTSGPDSRKEELQDGGTKPAGGDSAAARETEKPELPVARDADSVAPGRAPLAAERDEGFESLPLGAFDAVFRDRSEMVAKAYTIAAEKISDTLDEDILRFRSDEKRYLFRPNTDAATGLTKETVRQVNEIQNTLLSVPSGWFQSGSKRDVPRNACYVGHYGKCWGWVCPEGRAGLSEFTLCILDLASVMKEAQVVAMPSGIQFSPGFSNAAPRR